MPGSAGTRSAGSRSRYSRSSSTTACSSLAALIAYYAFFSLFPLLLAFVSILGFVLEGNPSLRDDVLDTALARIPVIGAAAAEPGAAAEGSGIALAVGLVGALWAGLGVTLALGRAFAEIWDVPRVEQPERTQGRGARARAPGDPRRDARRRYGGHRARGRRWTRPRRQRGRGHGRLARGQRRGLPDRLRAADPPAAHAPRAAARRRPRGARLRSPSSRWAAGMSTSRSRTPARIYGTFALVIGLLSWFLAGRRIVLLLAAEVNVVLRWRLWPRSLTGELEPADRRALRRFAEAARRDRRRADRRQLRRTRRTGLGGQLGLHPAGSHGVQQSLVVALVGVGVGLGELCQCLVERVARRRGRPRSPRGHPCARARGRGSSRRVGRSRRACVASSASMSTESFQSHSWRT